MVGKGDARVTGSKYKFIRGLLDVLGCSRRMEIEIEILIFTIIPLRVLHVYGSYPYGIRIGTFRPNLTFLEFSIFRILRRTPHVAKSKNRKCPRYVVAFSLV